MPFSTFQLKISPNYFKYFLKLNLLSFLFNDLCPWDESMSVFVCVCFCVCIKRLPSHCIHTMCVCVYKIITFSFHTTHTHTHTHSTLTVVKIWNGENTEAASVALCIWSHFYETAAAEVIQSHCGKVRCQPQSAEHGSYLQIVVKELAIVVEVVGNCNMIGD